MARWTINEILADAQARLPRLSAPEAAAAMQGGATLVDTRSNDLRLQDGVIPGAIHVPLSVLECRVDAASGHASPALAGRTDRLVLICRDGYSSSLAAVRLRELGFAETTDVIGGFRAWVGAGLPVQAIDARPSVFGAATVIVRGDRVLLVHHTYGELNWEIPGGGADPGESAEEAARREALEETGVTLAGMRLTGVYWETQGAFGWHHSSSAPSSRRVRPSRAPPIAARPANAAGSRATSFPAR